MQSKNALSNLKNRYAAVLKKCALLNTFGTLVIATMLSSSFMRSEAFATDNSLETTIKSMDATDGTYQSPLDQAPIFNTSTLNNYGNITGGATYAIPKTSGTFYLSAGMFGNSDGNIDYIFNNSGSININGNNNIYGIYAESTNANHKLTNSASIDINATADGIAGMYAEAAKGDHTLINSGNIYIKANGGASGMEAQATQNGSHTLTNSGTINVIGKEYGISGMNAFSTDFGSHTLSNSGIIKVSGKATISGMNVFAIGNHRLSNSGIISVSGDDNIFGMSVSGSSRNGIILLNNTGIITAKATSGQAAEVYVRDDYSIGTWATTLRTWNTDDAVFAGYNDIDLNFHNSTLILRPATATQGFVWGQEYNVAGINGMAAGLSNVSGTVSGKILQATTEVPFLKTTLTNGNDPANATVRLETNINAETTPATASLQGNLAVVQGQMSNITRKLLQTKYTEIYIDLVSDNGNSGIAAGSEAEQNKWTAFLTPYGSLTNNSEYNFDGSQMGVTGGASYNFSEKFSLGGHFDFNYAELDADIMDMDSDSTSFAFGLHANYNIMPQWYVSAQATGSISQIENEYSLTTGTSTKADYDSQALYLALNSGYVFEVAKGHTFTPQIGFSYLNMHADSYDIDWASAYSMYDMEYDSTSYSAFYADLNLNWRSAWQFENNNALALLASVGVRQNLSGSDIDSDFRVFGTEYSTRSSADDTAFLTDLGLEWSKKNFSLSLNYNGEYGNEQQVHGGAIQFKYMF